MIVRQIAERAGFSLEKMGKVELARGDALYAGLNTFEPGQEHRAHTHADQDKLYYVVAGRGELILDGETVEFVAGDLALARAGAPHGLKNPGPERLVVLVVFAPPPGGKP
jgi:quercetin dioxygenase-like cupin family protein